ncbi:MAG: 23S rRNA (guanosine(2251)-2'-O)-methyltransferase RlmB [Alphaproteobacteria bacterium]
MKKNRDHSQYAGKPKQNHRARRDKTEKKSKINLPDLYGFHAVREAWLNPDRDISALYISEGALKSFEDDIILARKKNLSRPDPTIIDKSHLDNSLHKGAVHQGIAICCSALPEMDEQDLIIKAANKGTSFLAILDQVTDPHNVGAILRSASAFGLDGVIMQKKHAPVLDGVLAKTACGAVDHIAVAQATNLARAVRALQDDGFFVIGLDEHSDEVIGATHNANEHDKIAVILGSEGDGIRHLIKDNCDILATLPTGGAIASLNVSNAAAVAFYALMKK